MSKEIVFSKLVKETLAAGHVSQTELAANVGVSGSTITKIKDGTIKQPKYNVAVRLIEAHARRPKGKK